MDEHQGGLHPDLRRVIIRLFREETFRLAVQAHPDQALSDYTLDDSEHKALQSLLTNWNRLPEAICELPQGSSHL